MSRYDTNLASEFFVLSSLHRLGAHAALTLANKKAVDIFVTRGRRTLTVEVKGVAGRYDWPASNIAPEPKERHFIVLVTYDGKISRPEIPPSVWVIPHRYLKPFIRHYRRRTNISRAAVVAGGERFKDAWWRIVGQSSE